MGNSYYYLFTVWREPGHELILERRTAKACKEYFGIGEKWDYFREKIEAGKEPGLCGIWMIWSKKGKS